jgi:hypothetical protein
LVDFRFPRAAAGMMMIRRSPAVFYLTFAILLSSIFTAFSPTTVAATALTYKIDANEKACFYAWVDKVGEKIAFYFAVLNPRPTPPAD